MSEIKQTNFRINQETADAFRAFCESNGWNQAQGFDHLIRVAELDKAKAAVPSRAVEIEEFEMHVKKVLEAYLTGLEITNSTEERVKEQFAADLQRKDKTIDDLREKGEKQVVAIDELNAANRENLEKIKTLEKDVKTAEEKAATAEKLAIDRESINNMLTRELHAAGEKAEKYDELQTDYLKAEEEKEKLEQQIQQLQTTLEDEKRHAAESLASEQEKAKLALDKTLLEKERQLMAQMQAEISKYQKMYYDLLIQFKDGKN